MSVVPLYTTIEKSLYTTTGFSIYTTVQLSSQGRRLHNTRSRATPTVGGSWFSYRKYVHFTPAGRMRGDVRALTARNHPDGPCTTPRV